MFRGQPDETYMENFFLKIVYPIQIVVKSPLQLRELVDKMIQLPSFVISTSINYDDTCIEYLVYVKIPNYSTRVEIKLKNEAAVINNNENGDLNDIISWDSNILQQKNPEDINMRQIAETVLRLMMFDKGDLKISKRGHGASNLIPFSVILEAIKIFWDIAITRQHQDGSEKYIFSYIYFLDLFSRRSNNNRVQKYKDIETFVTRELKKDDSNITDAFKEIIPEDSRDSVMFNIALICGKLLIHSLISPDTIGTVRYANPEFLLQNHGDNITPHEVPFVDAIYLNVEQAIHEMELLNIKYTQEVIATMLDKYVTLVRPGKEPKELTQQDISRFIHEGKYLDSFRDGLIQFIYANEHF